MTSADRPLALALSGGGARAAYQAGVLSGIAERAGGDVDFPIVTGVSAGAINAAGLCGHPGPLSAAAAHLERAWLDMSIDRVFRTGPLTLLASLVRWSGTLASGGLAPGVERRGLLDARPLRRMLSRVFDPGGIAGNLKTRRLHAIGLTATSYETGRTVTFVEGTDGAELPAWERAGRVSQRARITVDHVLASGALPLLFPAVEIDAQWYGDGGLRQTAPLAPAIHLGAGRILAVSLRYQRSVRESAERQNTGYPPPAQVLGMLLNAVFLDALDADAERLERINRTLALLAESGGDGGSSSRNGSGGGGGGGGRGRPHPEGLRPIELFVLHPSRDLGRLSADLARHLPASLRFVLRGLGSPRLRTPDFLSYLLFERPYIERLLDLGRHDARTHWDRIAPLLERPSRRAPALGGG